MTGSGSSVSKPLLQDLLNFLNASPSPFHAVLAIKQRLISQGNFQELREDDSWGSDLKPGGNYFLTRNGSCLCAFSIGAQWKPGNGFTVLAAHTDSPCLKVKPVSRREAHDYQQVGVQTYGGGLWHTWFDRDLSLAGRVIVEPTPGKLESRLVNLQKPILKIPSLAIHLDRSVNEEFKYNKETHLTPVLAIAEKQLNAKAAEETNAVHHSLLMNALGKQLNADIKNIRDMELCLYDTQPATLGGLNEEFIFSARLDNLMMSYCCIQALLNAAPDSTSEENVRMVLLFDNEEVGSESAQGAASNFLENIMRRLNLTFPHKEGVNVTGFERSVSKSLLVSADMAHAIHPNYSEKHESRHQPKMHNGLVLKHNANQRYATSSISSSIIASLASEEPAMPLQQFVVRNDSPCGSTIGPIVSAKIGLKTVDVGIAQLSMHSIREMCGVKDVESSIEILVRVLRKFSKMNIQE